MENYYQFEAGYGRRGSIWFEEAKCCVCNKIKMVLCIDNSEGEYGSGKICQECIQKLKEKGI